MVRIRRASATRVGSSGRPRSTSWTVRSRLCATRGRGRTGLPLLLVGMEDNYGDDWHIRENDDSQYMSLLEAGLDGASLTLMERKHGIARWRSERGESKPIELTAPDGKPTDTVYAYQSEPDEWRIYDKYGGRSLGGEPGETITDALRHIGYQLEES